MTMISVFRMEGIIALCVYAHCRPRPVGAAAKGTDVSPRGKGQIIVLKESTTPRR